MADVLVGFKWVLDEADVRIGDDLSVDFGMASRKINDYDKNAIEAGRRIAEQTGGSVFGVSCGADETRKGFVDALSRGLDAGIWVKTSGSANAAVAARAIAAVARDRDVALVVCSEGSSDDYARQTASRTGALLDWPVATSVLSVEMEGETALVRRRMDGCEQTVRLRLPAVVSVLPEINPAPIPGLKSVLAAKKKPVEELAAADLGIDESTGIAIEGESGYVSERKNVLVEGDSAAEKASKLVEALKREGVL
ncbi:electron transfer flavoprotein subunit beta/FixA family protein [Rubneribacter sp.]